MLLVKYFNSLPAIRCESNHLLPLWTGTPGTWTHRVMSLDHNLDLPPNTLLCQMLLLLLQPSTISWSFNQYFLNNLRLKFTFTVSKAQGRFDMRGEYITTKQAEIENTKFMNPSFIFSPPDLLQISSISFHLGTECSRSTLTKMSTFTAEEQKKKTCFPSFNKENNTYRHRSGPQEVQVCVLPKQVALRMGGVKLLSPHDEMAGEVASCRHRDSSSNSPQKIASSTWFIRFRNAFPPIGGMKYLHHMAPLLFTAPVAATAD